MTSFAVYSSAPEVLYESRPQHIYRRGDYPLTILCVGWGWARTSERSMPREFPKSEGKSSCQPAK